MVEGPFLFIWGVVYSRQGNECYQRIISICSCSFSASSLWVLGVRMAYIKVGTMRVRPSRGRCESDIYICSVEVSYHKSSM
jgi:hypothetical protein